MRAGRRGLPVGARAVLRSPLADARAPDDVRAGGADLVALPVLELGHAHVVGAPPAVYGARAHRAAAMAEREADLPGAAEREARHSGARQRQAGDARVRGG